MLQGAMTRYSFITGRLLVIEKPAPSLGCARQYWSAISFALAIQGRTRLRDNFEGRAASVSRLNLRIRIPLRRSVSIWKNNGKLKLKNSIWQHPLCVIKNALMQCRQCPSAA